MIALDQRSIEKEVDLLIKSFEPQLIANTRRDEITAFVTDTITQRLAGAIVVGCGSSSLKSYLPESDLDLVLITSKSSTDSSDDIDYLREVFDSFCEEVSQKDRGLSKYTDMCIRNIEFVNARTKVAHCLVNNVGVDLTINQTGAIASIIFLDEADSIIGKNHLLKRSILLVKVNYTISYAHTNRSAVKFPFLIQHRRGAFLKAHTIQV